jgi:hypothetical protein
MMMVPRGDKFWYTNVCRLAQLPGPLERAHRFNTDTLETTTEHLQLTAVHYYC